MKLKNLLGISAIGLILISCDRDKDESDTLQMTNEEIAELVANSITGEIRSMTMDLGGTTFRSIESSNGRISQEIITCGQTLEQTYTSNFESDSLFLQFEVTYTSTLECFLGFPVLLTSEVDAASSFESQRLITSSSTSGNSTIGVDAENLGNLLFNADLNQSGQVTQKRRAQNSLTIASSMSVTAVSINTQFIIDLLQQQAPTTELIESGAGAYNATVSNASGSEITISAFIQFIGDGAAEITLNGETFILDLSTGQLA